MPTIFLSEKNGFIVTRHLLLATSYEYIHFNHLP